MSNISRRTVVAGGLTASLLPLGGFNANSQAQTPKRGGTLRASIDTPFTSLHAWKVNTFQDYVLVELLYAGLTRIAVDMKPEPDLAQSWSSNSELTEWTFKLRPNLKFHDGSACTAKDVEASYKALLDPKMASPAGAQFNIISGMSVVDDSTIRFMLSQSYADFPILLGHQNAKIFPAGAAENTAKYVTSENGSGPFKLVSFEPDRRIVVERHRDYYDSARPYVDRIEVLVYPDSTAEISALAAGDNDMMIRVTPSAAGRVASTRGVKLMTTPTGAFLGVAMRIDQKPFDDIRVRQALALTLDREQIVKNVYEGYAVVGNDSPISDTYRYFANPPQRTRNIEEAKKLLTAAGYPNGLELTLVSAEAPATRRDLAVIVREMSKDAGFRINVSVMPNATFISQVWLKGAFMISSFFQEAISDVILSRMYITGAVASPTRWSNKRFDELVQQARKEANDANRAKLYAEAQRLMHDEVPQIIPAFYSRLAAVRDKVQGYQIHPSLAFFRLDHIHLSS